MSHQQHHQSLLTDLYLFNFLGELCGALAAGYRSNSSLLELVAEATLLKLRKRWRIDRELNFATAQ